MSVDYEELQTRIRAGEVRPEELTDEEVEALEANLTVTLREVHQAIATVFAESGEEVAEGTWQAISETIAMNRVLEAIFGALSGDDEEALAGLFGALGLDEEAAEV